MNKKGGNIIPLYDQPPSGSIAVEELEVLISTRMLILDQLESKIQKSDNIASVRLLLQNCDKEIGWSTSVEHDKTSHFLLALAFCRNDQERNWFANLESKLFILRLEYYGIDQEEVLKMLNIPLERQDISDQKFLELIRFRDSKAQNNSNTVFRIPFEYALNLIPTMQYFLYRGYVYVSKAEMSQLIKTVFKENLLKKLININKNIDRICSDSRINYLIKDLQMKREGNRAFNFLVEILSKSFGNQPSEHISMKDIEANVDKTYPLCMQILHKNLTSQGHLKHYGRLQYGLFLKGMGLSLEESLTFWKMKFAKSMPEDKFEKNYSYNIRHSYGKEGKRNDYIPWSCTRIQNLNPPSATESHGCPYKVYSEEKLKHILFDLNFKEIDVLRILEKKRNHEYSVTFCITIGLLHKILRS